MNENQEKLFMKEMTLRLQWYERILEGGKITHMHCNICKIFQDRIGLEKCEICPLDECLDTTSGGSLVIDYQIGNWNKKDFLKEMKKRYNWLIKKIEKAGYVYE